MFRLVKLIVWIAVISIGVLWWQYQSFQTQDVVTEDINGYLSVEKGESFSSVLGEIFESPLLVKFYLKQNPPDFQLQAGKYKLPSGNIEKVIESLKKPLSEGDENVTFLEGWNIYDIDKTLTIKNLISSGDFVNFVTDCESFCLLKKDYAFVSDAETLEGFLYPDTYAVNPSSFTIESLVRKMLTNFQTKVIDSGIITDMGSIEILDIINMASIVQKEANKRDNPEELALIAGILKKRAAEGWQIGADATVCYAHEIATEDCSPSEVLKYLYDINKYNTRQMIGLPKGPIANPEAEVIEATLKSKNSAYYYYLHDTTGQIHYGVTNADHEANKTKYLN